MFNLMHATLSINIRKALCSLDSLINYEKIVADNNSTESGWLTVIPAMFKDQCSPYIIYDGVTKHAESAADSMAVASRLW